MIKVPIINSRGEINPYCGTSKDSPSNYLYFSLWEKGPYKRVYANDYKKRSVGYIDLKKRNKIVSEYDFGDYIETMKCFKKYYKIKGEKKIMTKRKVYGVSSKFDFGKWEHEVYVFPTRVEAENWLNSEEYDFRDREIMTKTAAIKLAGKKAVDNAISIY